MVTQTNGEDNICIVCFKPFNYKKGKRYCSNKCRVRDYALNNKSMYKTMNFRQSEIERKRNYIHTRTHYYRDNILNIKHNMCELCGEKKGLELHHKRYIWYESMNKNMENISVLCRECHTTITKLNDADKNTIKRIILYSCKNTGSIGLSNIDRL